MRETSDSLDASTRLKPPPSVYARAFGPELVLLDFGRGEYYGLDEVGALVWNRIEAGDPLGVIAQLIADRYDVTRETALRDIVTLATELRDSGLVAVA